MHALAMAAQRRGWYSASPLLGGVKRPAASTSDSQERWGRPRNGQSAVARRSPQTRPHSSPTSGMLVRRVVLLRRSPPNAHAWKMTLRTPSMLAKATNSGRSQSQEPVG